MPVYSKILIYTFTFSENLLLTKQNDSQGQYVCNPKFGMNMGDMAKSPFHQFFLSLLFLFFSLNPSTSKTIRGTGQKFCTQVGSDDLTCIDLSKCL